MALAAVNSLLAAAEEPQDVLKDPAIDWSHPEHRERGLLRLRQAEADQQRQIRARALSLGLPIKRIYANGRISEIHGFSGDLPRYRMTYNANAAVSSGAALLQSAPYSLRGTGVTVGVWDGGSALASHQEFGGRVTIKDGSSAYDHSTHVAATIAASGVVASARGMAPSASVWSYDWNNDTSEMSAVAATAAAQATKIYLSNHSYGPVGGWDQVDGGFPYRKWEWNGGATAMADAEFGRYNSDASGVDAVTYNAPYFLPFWAAGNDRIDNPANGESIALAPNSSTVTTYNASLHPPGDGRYRNGFDTVAGWGVAKNVVTVGSVADAVTGGSRDVSKAAMDSFSCWGPTDDGRIKPDLVANGNMVYSAISGSNSSYASTSGTSMASPNACGSAALLVQQYPSLFPGLAMRAATLKALLIHTADDLGNPGPDYKSGWGLINVKRAADIIADHAAHPLKKHLTESSLDSSTLTRIHPFTWDGVSPIRATLCWTDPAGPETNTAVDSRASRLVRDLNLKIIAPDGTEYFPFVMPYTRTWLQADLDATATTGVNQVDPVEQIRIASPAQSGVFQAVVSVSTVPTSSQSYSLVLDGTADSLVPAIVQSVSPVQEITGRAVNLSLAGSGFSASTQVTLQRPGFAPVIASAVSVSSETSLIATFDLASRAPGIWDVVVQNGSSTASVLTDSITLLAPLIDASFDSETQTDWQSDSLRGTGAWADSTAASHSPSHSYFAPGTNNASTTALVSPPINIPADASELKLSFWHWPRFADPNDGAVFEYSTDAGVSWVDALDSGAGTTVISGDYNTFIGYSDTYELAGRSAWTGDNPDWIQTQLVLSDVTRFLGKTIRFRWVVGTSRRTPSIGWYVDAVTFGMLQPSHFDTPDSLATWRAGHFSSAEISSGIAASHADPDQDGLVNLAEYALGLDPHQAQPMPQAFAVPPQQGLILNRPGQLPNVVWYPQVSSNLTDWAPAVLTVLSPGPPESIQIQPPQTFSPSGRTFLRIGFQEK